MSMTFFDQLGVIPALLLVLPGLFILNGQDAEKSARRFLLYSLGMAVLTLLALFITQRFITEPYDQPFFQLSKLLVSSIGGLTALILLNVKALAGMNWRGRVMAILL